MEEIKIQNRTGEYFIISDIQGIYYLHGPKGTRRVQRGAGNISPTGGYRLQFAYPRGWKDFRPDPPPEAAFWWDEGDGGLARATAWLEPCGG